MGIFNIWQYMLLTRTKTIETAQNTPLKFDFNSKSILTDDILRLSVMLKRIANRRRLTDIAYKEITDWGNEIISIFDKGTCF